MIAFEWNVCFLTGEEAIDDQHHALVGLINRLGELVTNGAPITDGAVTQALGVLAEYAALHFADEEALMDSGGVDARTAASHRACHTAFVFELSALREQLAAGADTAITHLPEFLVHWLAQHILDVDQSLVRELRLIRSGLTPAAAREQELAHAHADPLLHALTGLFRLVSTRNAELAEANRTLEARVLERTRELALANERLENLALTDALTGLPNRRHALQRLEAAWEGTSPELSALSLLLIDADGFKQVNDQCGHDAGDLVLRVLARALAGAVRTDDLVSRLGGDEFCVLLPATAEAGALRIAEALRSAVAELVVDVADGRWLGSVSVGAASRTPDMVRASELLHAADAAMYVAKRGGRNCVATEAGVVRVAEALGA